MAKRDVLPEWLTDDLLIAAMAERELAKRGLLPEEDTPALNLTEFVEAFRELLELGVPLMWGWALDAMALHLEAAARREIRKLIINVPPGTMKCRLTNVFFPAWVWGEPDPSERFLAVSYTVSLSMSDSVAMRRLILSAEYQVRYGERQQLTRDQNAKGRYDTTARDFRQVKPLSSATDARAGILLIDDPNNATKIYSPAERRTINHAYDQSLRMRGANRETFVQIYIMQRLHEENLTGHRLKKGGWEHLRLPEEYEPEHHTRTTLWSDPRMERGELQFPECRNRTAVGEMKRDLGRFGTAGQLQQRPVPAGGGIIKRWWRYHSPAALLAIMPPVRVLMLDGTEREIHAGATPERFNRKITSWDMSFMRNKDSNYMTGQALGQRDADTFLLDQTRGQWGFVQTKREVIAFTGKHPTSKSISWRTRRTAPPSSTNSAAR